MGNWELVYVYRDTYLEESFIVYPFIEITVGSLLGSMNSPAMGSWLIYHTRHMFSSAERPLNPTKT